MKTEPMITHHFELPDREKAFAAAQNLEGIKVMLHPNGITE